MSAKNTKQTKKSAPAKGKTPEKAKGPAKPATKAKSGKPAEPAPPPIPWPKISPERRMDILGAVLALIGFFSIFAFASTTNGAITSGWLNFLTYLFGWGSYIVPIVLIFFGGTLVFRKVERLPRLSPERATGLILLFFFLLTFLQLIADNPPPEQGIGGGYIGSVIYRALDLLFDAPGAFVILVAWLLIAVILTFNISMQKFFERADALILPIGDKIKAKLMRKSAPEKSDFEGGFIPFNRNGATDSSGQTPPTPATAISAASQPTITTGIPTTAIVWKLPSHKEILDLGVEQEEDDEFIQHSARVIEETLASFGAPVQVVEISRGPSITQFGVEPLFTETRAGKTRVRVARIAGLADDLALALAAPRIRIQAPVPGRSYVGIEVPNDKMALVTLREILESETFSRNKKPLSFALGRDVAGHPTATDLTGLPHLLIAGTTGSGKSVCVNSILTNLLLYNTPDDLRIILVDPKRVELTGYNGLPHLLSPVVVEMDRVIGALQWMTREMDRRYHEFAQVGSRNIQDYNVRIKNQGGKKMPYIVVIIDELADLMMLAPDETERTITRLAQLARATGIHLILATQRPSVDVVTGIIKANFPARIAFAVASNTDSRVILDQPGAERLLGRGDMLYQAPDAPAPVRLQGVFIADHEIHRLVDFWRAQNPQSMSIPVGGPVDSVPSGIPLKQTAMFEDMTPQETNDPLYTEAVDLVRREGRASVSMLQRRLRIGYTRASRLVDTMEEKKIIGQPQDATGVRPVLDYGPAAPPKEN